MKNRIQSRVNKSLQFKHKKKPAGRSVSVTRWQQRINKVKTKRRGWKLSLIHLSILWRMETKKSHALNWLTESSVNSLSGPRRFKLYHVSTPTGCKNLQRQQNRACYNPGTRLSWGPFIAKNFCGSILADCFVLTPHNNQLRHCQRNTHRSRVQKPVPPPALPPAGARRWHFGESAMLETHTFHGQVCGVWWLEGLTLKAHWGCLVLSQQLKLCKRNEKMMVDRINLIEFNMKIIPVCVYFLFSKS